MTIETPPHETSAAAVPDVPPIDASGTVVGAPKTGRRWVDIAAPLLGIAIFFGLWFLLHEWILEHVFDKPNFLVPSPVTVVDQAFLDGDVRGDLLKGILWTAVVALLGLSISIVVGMTIAILMAQATWVERSFWPYLIAAQAIPILAIVPLIGNILGFGLGSRVLVCVIISIFPIVSNTLFGLLSADASQHDLFTLKGVSRRTRLRKLQLPGAMPAIFTG
ncbi:MAG: ABC transporter permease subunit, partial [Ilumatobacteraceae bacterium]